MGVENSAAVVTTGAAAASALLRVDHRATAAERSRKPAGRGRDVHQVHGQYFDPKQATGVRYSFTGALTAPSRF
jgi:hypothetical protein